LQLAERVVVCYEAGCFGYEPARAMQRLGAELLVVAPQGVAGRTPQTIN
jgi:hypothetical protein